MTEPMCIDFEPVGKRGEAKPGQTLLQAAQEAGVGLAAICSGLGTCEECRVQVLRGEVSPPTLVEEAALGKEALAAGWRLACQVMARGAVKIHIPPESLTATQRLQIEGQAVKITPDEALHRRGEYGLAVDIGTTKVAAYLVRMESGETAASAGAMNPQIAFGEDVVSRIAYAGQTEGGAKRLQAVLMETLNRLLRETCAEAGIKPQIVVEAVLVGNTAMHHLAAGLPVEQLGHAPFAPATTEALNLAAESIGLGLGHGGQVYFPPVIAGYVGADHLAMLLACGLEKVMEAGNTGTRKTVIALDIGTNTEISLAARGRITCCSCASGPAFEGAHIKEGMRAAPGAVERVRWQEGGFRWQTIEGLPAVGICGSGILDTVAALLDGGLLKANGQLLPGNEITLVPAGQSGLGRDLRVRRKDVHEIQLAKAAIRAGVETLLRNFGLCAEDVDAFIVAGAFGTYLDLRSAVRVGMFPPIALEKFQQVGNAAGVGARQMLVSLKRRKAAEKLAAGLGYAELATDKRFMEMYLKDLGFCTKLRQASR